MPVFFIEKIAKASLILSTKNISVFGYKVLKQWVDPLQAR